MTLSLISSYHSPHGAILPLTWRNKIRSKHIWAQTYKTANLVLFANFAGSSSNFAVDKMGHREDRPLMQMGH